MPTGYLSLVLHAHLPYVRHPEHKLFLEEQWFFEALTETYLPLIRMIERLEEDEVGYALLLSLSPTLVAMFKDDLLCQRYNEHLEKLIALADREIRRTHHDAIFNQLAHWYANHLRDMRYWYNERCGRDLTATFRRLAAHGHLELQTCAATHGLLPLLRETPASIRAQIHTAVEYHESVFGVATEGIWLPECAYFDGLDAVLHEAGIRYFFIDAHGLENADTPPVYGIHAPVFTPAGVAAFARDRETSYQVWAANVGYPGHPDYREFYRDIGYELPLEELNGFIIDKEIRTNTGIKYYRVTNADDPEHKEPYNPTQAQNRAAEHAGDFVANRQRQAARLHEQMDRPPLIVSPYDAELFGHWWFEGPHFLEIIFRKLHFDQPEIEPITPRRYLQLYPENQVVRPAGSSWGGDGSYEFWLNSDNAKLYPGIHHAGKKMTELVDTRLQNARKIERRVFQQMARELLLAQASDWPFIMRTGTSPEYAQKRVNDHLSRFQTLAGMLLYGAVDEDLLRAIELLDPIFPAIRPEWFATSHANPEGQQ